MKTKTLIYILITLIIITTASARYVDPLVDKPLNITIPNCYSVNISAELTEGAVSDLQFVGCTKIDDSNFDCNCLNIDNNNFSIIMRTTPDIIRNIREYDIYLNVKYFETYRKTMSLTVDDGGDYYEVYNSSWIDRDKKIIIKQVPVYINNTIYSDKIVYVNQTVFKDRNVTIEKIEYIENTTKIDELNKDKKQMGFVIGVLIGLIILISIYIGFAYYQSR